MNTKPYEVAVVDTTIAEHVANEAHGLRYGHDWIYHDDRLGYLPAKPTDTLPAALARQEEGREAVDVREIKRWLNGDVIPVLLDVSNGIHSPALPDMARAGIRRIEATIAALARQNDGSDRHDPPDGLELFMEPHGTDARRERREAVCASCDGTGDVHRPDGEWAGKCNCGALPDGTSDQRRHSADCSIHPAPPSAGEGLRYFAADPAEGEFQQCDTIEQARTVAQSMLDAAEDDAAYFGWSDDPPQICYGVVLGVCVEDQRKPTPEGSEFAEVVSFVLRERLATPAPPANVGAALQAARNAAWEISDEGVSHASAERIARAVIAAGIASLTAASLREKDNHVVGVAPEGWTARWHVEGDDSLLLLSHPVIGGVGVWKKPREGRPMLEEMLYAFGKHLIETAAPNPGAQHGQEGRDA